MARSFDGVAAWRVVVLMGAIILATLIGIASGEAATREWSAFGQNETIIIADCRDCDENTGMSVACHGSGQPAEVTVESVAVENGREGAVLPIDIDIDGQVFIRQASTTFFGLVGYH
jgi:hypothetical protein